MNQNEFDALAIFFENHLNSVFGNSNHPKEVRNLAKEIFLQLRTWYQLEIEEYYFLELAALLHDVGTLFGESKHHKNSFEYIMNLNFSCKKEDKLIIANIARYHRKAVPHSKHRYFKILSPNQKYLVLKLSAILRIADALDRSHTQNISKLILKMDNENIYFEITPRNKQDINNFCSPDFQIEKLGFDKKKNLFEQIFKKNALIIIN
ncbi:MAG: HD domain-containing protein [Candidatus Margulisiibacteriota bacterium]|jgi:exopolyphosphatase/guanosine-5'-triphosphate,3'-diphosphate pyrophosphatase